jgi:hypothetical protein
MKTYENKDAPTHTYENVIEMHEVGLISKNEANTMIGLLYGMGSPCYHYYKVK